MTRETPLYGLYVAGRGDSPLTRPNDDKMKMGTARGSNPTFALSLPDTVLISRLDTGRLETSVQTRF